MIALAATSPAAVTSTLPLPTETVAVSSSPHFLLPQDAATKTASKLLKLQQIRDATLSTLTSRAVSTHTYVCVCVCVCELSSKNAQFVAYF